MTNADKYKTAQERAEAFRAFCDANSESHRGCGCEGCPLQPTNNCHFAWLDLEAEEEKPLPCPFCGNKDLDRNIYDEYENVSCVKCGYKSADFGDLAEAIAAHNRVAKAVKESEAK